MDKIWIYVWKQRKLESLLDNLQNNTLSRADLSYEKGKIKNIHYGDILIKFGEILNIKKEQLPNIVNEDVVKKYKTSILQNGDIVFVDTAEDETVGKCSEIAGLTDEIVLSGLHTIPCRPKLKFADGYLGYYLNSEIFHQQLLPFMQGIKVTSISKAAMKKMNIIYPKSVEEQAKIGGYFYNLDNLITFHHRKLNILNKIYRYAWEQRKLSECAGFRRGSFPQPYGNKDWYDGEGAQPFVQVADVSSDMKLVDDTKQKISKLAQPMSVFAEKGSVLVTLQGSIGRVAITQYGAYVDRTVLIFDKYNDDINKKFWAYIIKEKFVEEARKAPGGTIKTITKEALSDFDLMLPCYEEQSKLAEFLLNLDNLITLHQQKCKQLQIIRKFMLKNMFL